MSSNLSDPRRNYNHERLEVANANVVREAQNDYDSDSSSEESSDYSSSDDAENLDWIDCVNNRGDLLYLSNEATEGNQASNELSNDGYFISASNENLLNLNEEGLTHKKKLLKPTKKLKHLIRKTQQKQIAKEETTTLTDCPSTSHETGNNASLVDYDVYDLMFIICYSQKNFGRRASRFESMLGMIMKPRNECNNSEHFNSVIINGFIPDNFDSRNQNLFIGDWIRFINNVEVDCNNVNRILESCYGSNKVKLTIYRQKPLPASRSLRDSTRPNIGSMKVVPGSVKSEELSHQFQHIVMFLNPSSSSASHQSQNDIKYCYPCEESKLKTVRGLFYTLCNIMPDITASIPTSSSLIHEENVIHVCYVVEDKNVMVFAIPAICLTLIELQSFCNAVAKFLRLQHKTLSKAFGNSENKEDLDALFSELFQMLLIPRCQMNASYFLTRSLDESVELNKSLPLPDDVHLSISDALNELEAADFSDFTNINHRRMFNILGCCFHYKSYLIANHLPPEDLEDVYLLLRFNFLLKMTSSSAKPMSLLIMWKEIFLSERTSCDQIVDDILCNVPSINAPRYFILTVGMKHALLTMLLETSGFIPSQQEVWHPGPNPMYIDKTKESLQMMFDDGIISEIDHELNRKSSDLPLGNPESFLKKQKGSLLERGDGSKAFNLFPKSSAASSESSPKQQSISDLKLVPKHVDTDIDGSSFRTRDTNNDISPILGRRHNRASQRSNFDLKSRANSADNLLLETEKKSSGRKSLFDFSSLKQENEKILDNVNFPVNKSSVYGHQNTLFQYMTIDNSEGVALFPIDTLNQNRSAVHVEVIENFRRCCLIMRKTFQNSHKNKDRRNPRENGIFSMDDPLNHINEQGLMFTCNIPGNKKQSSLVYWVLGRQFMHPEPREIYVCHHESAPENTIQLAFKFGLGWSG